MDVEEAAGSAPGDLDWLGEVLAARVIGVFFPNNRHFFSYDILRTVHTILWIAPSSITDRVKRTPPRHFPARKKPWLSMS